MVQTVDDAFEFWRWLSEQKRVAFDTETTGLDLYNGDTIRLIQFGTVNDAWVMDFQMWKGLVADVFTRFTGFWVAHNSRFDITALNQAGIHVPWERVHDTMIALRLARPTESAALKNAADAYVSSASSRGQKLLGEAMRKNKWGFGTVPLDFPPFLFYSALDTVLTARLDETDVVKEGRASPVYQLEMQVRAIATRMENNGTFVDVDVCSRNAARLRHEADEISAHIAGTYDFAPRSTKQLAHWLASQPDALSRMSGVTSSGQLSTDKEALGQLIGAPGAVGEVAEMVLRMRQCEKIAGTYLEGFVNRRDPNGYMHPQIETIAARTGRMSVRDPALQTLPKPTMDSEYRIVREGVVPPSPDYCIVSCDSDQIELRLTASISKDVGLIEAFQEADETGVDFFTTLARGVYAAPEMPKSDKRRDRIKTFTYASLYGAGVPKMAKSAGVSVKDMRDVRDEIAGRYPGFFRMSLEAEHELNVNGGYIETAYGRRLPVPEFKPYVAVNYKIQGTAADVLKQSLVNLANAGLEQYMWMPVHDEVVFCLPRDAYDDAAPIIAESMTCLDFDVPLTASPSAPCENWADAK